MIGGGNLRRQLQGSDITTFIGVYDVFSASIAAKYYDGIFLSGFSFSASHYGLPDIGFVAWPDMVSFARRVKSALPNSHILVDIDDGYADAHVACHVVSLLEAAGCSGVIIEDQQRPRRCGHYEDKHLLPLEEYIHKLRRVLAVRREMIVVARTDANSPDEILQRAQAFEDAGADAILVDAIKDIDMIRLLRAKVNIPILFNQITGGKSATLSLREMKSVGISLAVYSTPCLFAAQAAIEAAMKSLKDNDGLLVNERNADIQTCTTLLNTNLKNTIPGTGEENNSSTGYSSE